MLKLTIGLTLNKYLLTHYYISEPVLAASCAVLNLIRLCDCMDCSPQASLSM